MGEAKRRKKLDPNFGKTPDLMVSAFCQNCVEGKEGGRFQRCVDAALDQSTDLHYDLLVICFMEACLRYPSVGVENMENPDIAAHYFNASLELFKQWGLNPTEENAGRALDQVKTFLETKAFEYVDAIEANPRAAIEDFFKKYAYAET